MRENNLQKLPLAACVTLVMVTACQPDIPEYVEQDHLPPEAITAFQAWVADYSENEVSCTAAAIQAAPRELGLINEDQVTDYALQPGLMACDTRSSHLVSTSFFRSYRTCAFPALISDDSGWHVESMMSGNQVETYVHYQEARFRVSQPDFSDPRGETIIVRDYAWRDGRLGRVSVRREHASLAPNPLN
jgi:hypothetical protein